MKVSRFGTRGTRGKHGNKEYMYVFAVRGRCLAAGDPLRRQNTAQAGSAGAGDFAGVSGEVDAGLAGHLVAVLRVLCGCTLRALLPRRRSDGGAEPGAAGRSMGGERRR